MTAIARIKLKKIRRPLDEVMDPRTQDQRLADAITVTARPNPLLNPYLTSIIKDWT